MAWLGAGSRSWTRGSGFMMRENRPLRASTRSRSGNRVHSILRTDGEERRRRKFGGLRVKSVGAAGVLH